MKSNPEKSKLFSLLLLFLIASGFSACNRNQAPEQPNVLFIIVDDLRPELKCYGSAQIHSPNIDRLAEEGLLFEQAYCNVAVCGASRASLFTGLRPTRTRFLTFQTWAEREVPDAVALPRHFRDNGYYTISNGKVFHHQTDKSDSWDENWRPGENTTWRDYHRPENLALDTVEGLRGPPFESLEADDTIYFDGKIAEKSIADLKRLKEKDQPFFLAVGFLKPHLPFNAPKKYWDLYDYNLIRQPLNNYIPENAPAVSIHNSGELRSYGQVPGEGPVPDSLAKKLIQGYYACVSYTDAQIGKVLQALQDLELDKNTIVVLLGDHGWNLQEHTMWCKHCSYGTSQRSALLIRSPGKVKGKKTSTLAEYVDIYPTLCDLCGLALPSYLEGKSLVPVLKDPDSQGKDFVISKWRDGLTLITQKYAYTEWNTKQDSTFARMLYDHTADPGENINIAVKPGMLPLMDSLSLILRENRGKDY